MHDQKIAKSETSEVARVAQDGVRQWGLLAKTCGLCRSPYLSKGRKRLYCPPCREVAMTRMKRVHKRLYHLRRMEPERLAEVLEAVLRVARERPAMASWVRMRVGAAPPASLSDASKIAAAPAGRVRPVPGQAG